jgi:hypothetical protein
MPDAPQDHSYVMTKNSQDGGWDMGNIGLWLRIAGLLVVISLGSVSNVESQDLFREMDQLKKELSALKNEVKELRDVVYGLRRAALNAIASQGEGLSPERAPAQETAKKPETILDEQQATSIICKTVGKFFSDAETILQSGDTATADARMKQALVNLNSSLKAYTGMHRVDKILRIYEGLAWDAYVAVELRGSVAGNEDFREALSRHRRKYVDTCPKQ